MWFLLCSFCVGSFVCVVCVVSVVCVRCGVYFFFKKKMINLCHANFYSVRAALASGNFKAQRRFVGGVLQ